MARIVIPRGSPVTAVVSNAKQPGKVKGKGELYLRFDSLTLPNGVTRDFRARLSGVDAGRGDLDRDEGKITSPGGKAADARTGRGRRGRRSRRRRGSAAPSAGMRAWAQASARLPARGSGPGPRDGAPRPLTLRFRAAPMSKCCSTAT